jgi:hypothetical protein
MGNLNNREMNETCAKMCSRCEELRERERGREREREREREPENVGGQDPHLRD